MNPLIIEINNRQFQIERCRNQADLFFVQALDDLVFGNHQDISAELLRAIFEQDGLLVYKIKNQIIGQSQCLFYSACDIKIEETNTALFYGTAVLPEFRNQQIGKALALAQEKIAVAAGKTKALLTVRPENGISLIMRYQLGFNIKNWLPDYYGVNNGRLLLEKCFDTNSIQKPEKKQKAVNQVSIQCGDDDDQKARQQIAACFSSGQRVTGFRLISTSAALFEFS
ncbi:MAG: GNAT family N-acetyltransferase [Bacteroidetes bacterium]|nr:GNAT family N-acetyltransferase [Bacteroidota bacterium]MBU1578264.1 GNAT family N-acetyltransferase [Bacteroidota bacterium]MBU2465119.1 GNAT family N-acetyltransferase [Bacteroidota bacterium]MBU2556335.1 GNAT family N-acetyltransferase [Bacteroidota bacterium]